MSTSIMVYGKATDRFKAGGSTLRRDRGYLEISDCTSTSTVTIFPPSDHAEAAAYYHRLAEAAFNLANAAQHLADDE